MKSGVRSGPGRPAGGDSLETRQRVIDAACKCFANFGYGPATNNLIAEMAGVTAGSVYYHFGSKRNLFEAVCDDVYGKILGRTTALMVGAESVRGLLRKVLAESNRINHESPDLAGFVATAPVDARRHSELTEAFARQAERMRTTLVGSVIAGQQAGRIPPELNPAEVAGMIGAIVDGFAHAAAATDAATLDRITAVFDTLMLGADEN